VTEELGEAYVKGAIYEGLLERKAAEVKSGAGQYFTPRPLIDAIIEVVDPAPGKTVCDPACGTGKFLLQAYANMKPKARDRVSSARVRNETFTGYDVVPGVVRLAAMNLYLHGIGDSQSPVYPQGLIARRSGPQMALRVDQSTLRPQAELPRLHR
jgi:type I restriction enzyme M protein